MNPTLLALACLLPACVMASDEPMQYESFEDGIPAYFTPTRPESLSISSWHSKQGKNSLRWDWRQGEELVVRHGIGDITRTGGLGNGQRAAFAVWLYMEQPIDAALLFEFRQGAAVRGSFRFPLAFTGWRQGRPLYRLLLASKTEGPIDQIRIAAPVGVAKGTVFLDFIKYNTLTHPSRMIFPEKEMQWRRPAPDPQRHPTPEGVTEAERAGIRQLLGPEMGPGIDEARVKRLCARVQALGIVRDEHGLRGGPGIDRHYQYCCEFGDRGSKTQDYWPDEHGPDWLSVQSPAATTSLAAAVAAAYRASRDSQHRRRLAEAFLLLEDHLYDQGMQAGAGFHWNWWVGGPWAEAVFLMRDALSAAGRLERQCDYALWNFGGDEIFAEGNPRSHMDYYLLDIPRLLRACLLQPQATEQVRWLRAFKATLERSILQPSSALKIDGSAYHHGGHYFGYAFAAVPGLAETVQRLSGTPWRLSAEAHERVLRAALAQRIFCNQRDLPLALSGRQPFVPYCSRLLPDGLDRLARSGTPDGRQAVDPQAAAAYLRLVPTAAAQEPYCRLGMKPEPEPSGCFVMPYAALLCQRRDNWLVSVHGQSKYVWGTERQSKVNCFGLFQGLGHLEVLAGGNPVTAKASGRDAAGWDWRCFEGTTVPQIPLERIDKGWTSPYSPETFVGGLSHQGQQGMFAMIVKQPVPGGKTLQGRKSWFFDSDQVVCLGSDISCDEAEHPTHTTLCQRRLTRDEKGRFAPTFVDGVELAGFPDQRTLDDARAHWFLDVQQTGYYLPAGQKIHLARRHQRSREYQDQGDTEGDFLTAWVDHGKAPHGASYEYVVVVRADAATMQRLAAERPYRVLQRDASAHLLWSTPSGRWSGAMFAAQEIVARAPGGDRLPLKAVDRPCLITADAVRDGILNLTLSDPDLNLGKVVGQSGPAPLPSHRLRVTLHGDWRLLETTATVCAWRLPDASEKVRVVSTRAAETVVEIICEHGASYGLRLAAIK